ncbi:hypothetical protein FQN54_003922 [Arachnomyces sp. PD_36]|nr:hypothetical protein FQN54_003922 [Arachnomyces sp. PD_36]
MPGQPHGERNAASRSPAATALRNFSSQWVLIAQGTGIIAVILHQLDYQFKGLKTISEIVWVYSIALLLASVLLYLLRTAIYPSHVKHSLKTSLLELTSLSNTMTTFFSIIEMIALTLVADWSPTWGLVAYILWWINTSLSILACIAIPYINFKHQPPTIPHMTPALLLPFLAAITSAAAGGTLAIHGSLSPRLQVPMILVSYLQLGFGFPIALIFDGIFLNRLLHANAFPTIGIVYQTMILVGPWGQGSFALQILGQAVGKGSFAAYGSGRGTILTAEATIPISIASQFFGFISWGYDAFWCAFASLMIIRCIADQPGGWRHTQFSVGVWSIVFPLGVFINGAVNLGKILDSPTFDVLSTAFFLILLVIWIFLQILTVKGIWTGKLLGLDKGWRNGRYRREDEGEVYHEVKGKGKENGKENGDGGGRSTNDADLVEKGEGGSEPRRRKGEIDIPQLRVA